MANATPTPGYGFAANNSSTVESSLSSFLYPHHPADVAAELITTAQNLVYPRGVGIYATDETPEGIEARLIAALGEEGKQLKWTAEERRERRRRWRECLYESIPTGIRPTKFFKFAHSSIS